MQALVVAVGLALLVLGVLLLLGVSGDASRGSASAKASAKVVGVNFTGPPGLLVVFIGVLVILFPLSPWWPDEADPNPTGDPPATSAPIETVTSPVPDDSTPVSSASTSATPASDAPDTTSESRMGSDDRPDPETLYLEFEDGELVKPLEVVIDLDSSSGAFVQSPTRAEGEVSLDLDIAQGGRYELWARVMCADPCVGRNSTFVSLNGGKTDTWDFFEDDPNPPSNEWVWDRISLRDGGTFENHLTNPWTPELRPGVQRLTFSVREPLAALDVLVVTNDPDFVP